MGAREFEISRPRIPSMPAFVGGRSICMETGAERTPSEAWLNTSEAVPGLARFQEQALEAGAHILHGGLRIQADCSTDGP
eukprot:3007833-Alexandrium_andersonii.AAC.1